MSLTDGIYRARRFVSLGGNRYRPGEKILGSVFPSDIQIERYIKNGWVAMQAESASEITNGGMPAYIVAASNASQHSKDIADVVCDGVADQVEIQAAYDALQAMGIPGLVLRLTEGSFYLTAPLVVGVDDGNIMIEGQNKRWGLGTTLKPGVAGAFSVVSINTGEAGFRNLNIQDDTTYAMTAPVVDAIGDALFENCWIMSYNETQTALNLNGGHVEFRGGGISGGHSAAKCVDGTSSKLSGFGAAFSSYVDGQYCLDLNDPNGGNQEHVFWDCEVDGGLRVVQIAGLGSLHISGGKFSSWDLGTDAIYVENCEGVIIHGGVKINTSSSAESGIHIVSCNEVEVSNFFVDGARRHGIHVMNSSDGRYGPGQIRGASRETATTYSGVFVDGNSDGNFISGLKIRGATSGNRPLYGIRINAATCDANYVAVNDLRGASLNGGSEYSDAGTATTVTAANRI